MIDLNRIIEDKDFCILSEEASVGDVCIKKTLKVADFGCIKLSVVTIRKQISTEVTASSTAILIVDGLMYVHPGLEVDHFCGDSLFSAIELIKSGFFPDLAFTNAENG